MISVLEAEQWSFVGIEAIILAFKLRLCIPMLLVKMLLVKLKATRFPRDTLSRRYHERQTI
jgi:hypothetical protein